MIKDINDCTAKSCEMLFILEFPYKNELKKIIALRVVVQSFIVNIYLTVIIFLFMEISSQKK